MRDVAIGAIYLLAHISNSMHFVRITTVITDIRIKTSEPPAAPEARDDTGLRALVTRAN